ncbi:hypothetical protein JCM9533A_49120 [Catenuloplanes niger JCM 9533]
MVRPDAFDDASVQAWLTSLYGSDAASAVVTVEVEDVEMRARRTLTVGLTRAFIAALAELRRLRRAGERRAVVDGHPSWCTRMESAGEPHRSREVEAAEEHNGDVIRVWLALGASQGDARPRTLVEMRTDGVVLEWPPLTLVQHAVLLRKLAHLLEQLHSADAEAPALRRSA